MIQSIVKEVGPLVEDFKEEKLLVFFGPNAPEDLREFSIIHEFQTKDEKVTLREGDTITLNGATYTLDYVGSTAEKNFNELGHISIYFYEPEGEMLPGSVHVSPAEVPDITEGSDLFF